MNKKFIVFIFAFVFMCSNFYYAKAADKYNYDDFYKEMSELIYENKSSNFVGTMQFFIGDNKLLVNYKEKQLDSKPVTIEDRVFLPIRVITEEGGGKIEYSNNNIYINDSGNYIQLTIGSNIMYVNKKEIILDASPVIIDNRTLVPLRAVSESLGYNVIWDKEKQSITLSKDFQTMRLIIKAKYKDFNPDKYGAVKIIRGPDNLYILQFDSIKNTQECYNILIKLEEIEFAEPDKYIPPIIEQPKQNIKAIDKNQESWGAERIKSPEYAQKLIENGKNSEVVVAVIDTGIDKSHQYLNGRILDTGYNFVSGNNDTNDDHYHGTHVAGIIVECTPGLNVKILPVKALGNDGSGTDLAVASGIQYAVNNGADIINLSLREPCQGTSHYIDSMIQYAISNNVTVVSASGNDFSDTKYFCPSHNQNVIVVGAVDSYDKIADFSNYGSSVDVAAPGVDILSCIPNNRFAMLSGTSMASPHVAAIAAMYKIENPSWTPYQIESEIKLHTDDKGTLGWDSYYGEGIPNLFKVTDIPGYQPKQPDENENLNDSNKADSYISSLNCTVVDNKLVFDLETSIAANKVLIYFNDSQNANEMSEISNGTRWGYQTGINSIGTLKIKIAIYDSNDAIYVYDGLLNIIYR